MLERIHSISDESERISDTRFVAVQRLVSSLKKNTSIVKVISSNFIKMVRKQQEDIFKILIVFNDETNDCKTREHRGKSRD